ncbi:MAG: GTPase domain-containing protein [Planctomycetes bacterium]|nr:GTPase domain-containing protein [Planctomycetota bacterium]
MPVHAELEPAEITGRFRRFADSVERLARTLRDLERHARLLKVAPLHGREWYELLRQKLVPQLRDEAFLVVAVVGGTNIGKSVIFNHLAGCRASATSPLASGTKHPVCLVPPRFVEQHDLAAIFQGFRLLEWDRADAALEDRSEHCLFWRKSPQTPENLLVLDTPDIDSDAPVNWQRADHIRRCADVLIAVLTQQKYNDAAVKQFFRKAAAEDKAVIVVFNQCQLPEDDEYWPLWLGTFSRETGVEPEIVYVAPSDRRAAEANALGFYERDWKTAETARGGGTVESDGEARDLADDLSRLKFAEIKLRTLRGSLKALVDADFGVPTYLREVDVAGGRFRSASEILSAEKLARLDSWPPVPNRLLVNEIREWWREQREGWSAKVHNFYNTLGTGLTWPFRIASKKLRGEQPEPWDVYRKREWSAILETVEKAYERLTMLRELGNPLLTERLDAVLGGTSRVELLRTLEAEHGKIDFEQELSELVVREMRTFRDESPRFYEFLKRLDKTAALVRPATSVVLFVVGVGPAGDAAAHAITDTALQTVIHTVGDVTGGTVAAAVGDTAISGTASSSMGYVEAKFRRLQAGFTARRVGWLIAALDRRLWGTLLEELATGAGVSESQPYREVQAALEILEKQLAATQPETVAG